MLRYDVEQYRTDRTGWLLVRARQPGEWKGAHEHMSLLPEPRFPRGSRLSLVHLVIRYRGSWEVHIDDDGIWVAQGITRSNGWVRIEADNPACLEREIKKI